MDNFIGFPANINKPITPVQPETEIYLASGIRWDNSYIHVRGFDSATDLLNHVISKIPSEDYHITGHAPVRTGELEVRIPANETLAMQLNYMAYKNAPYENTWHFAFITNVSWLSANSVKIEFELDIFSECYYTMTALPCFVERMHIPKSEDIAGSNLVPDDIETGVMQCYRHGYTDFGKTYINMYISEYPGGTPEYATHFRNGIYSGVYMQSYPCSNQSEADNVDSILEKFKGKEDAILLMTVAPAICLPDDTSPDGLSHSIWESQIDLGFGYTPKNQKIFTYPYVYMVTDDNSGNVNIFKPELFSGDKWEFEFIGCSNNMPQILGAPINYSGISGMDYMHSFVTSNFPIVAFTYDAFKAYVAQNKNSLALGLMQANYNMGLGFIAGGLGGAKAGGGSQYPVTGAIGATAGAITGAMNGYFQKQSIMATLQDKEFIPAQTKGKVNSENIKFALELNRIDFYAMRPTINMLKTIDNYWTAFGYPIHDIVTPNLKSRSSWNYIKTVDCGFTADAEMAILSQFRDLFNRGITIWHTNDIGNYSLDNN